MSRLTNLIMSAMFGISALGCFKNYPVTFDNPVLHQSHLDSEVYEIYVCREGDMLPQTPTVLKQQLTIKYDHENWERATLELERAKEGSEGLFDGVLHLRPHEKVPIYVPPTPEPNHFPYNLEYKGMKLLDPSYMPNAKCPEWQWQDHIGILPTGKFNPIRTHVYKFEDSE